MILLLAKLKTRKFFLIDKNLVRRIFANWFFFSFFSSSSNPFDKFCMETEDNTSKSSDTMASSSKLEKVEVEGSFNFIDSDPHNEIIIVVQLNNLFISLECALKMYQKD